MSATRRTGGDVPDYGPHFPADRQGVAILGCGAIAQSAHLPAYADYGVGVTGVWSRSPQTTAGIRDRFPFIGKVYDDVNDLLADPEVRIVDIATGPEGRLSLIQAAIAAGKHVLAQKPLTTDADELAALPALLERAGERNLRIAVNHNGRWAPAWRLATLLVRDGAIGDVVGVTHLHDKPLPPIAGTSFDDIDHMLLSDYLMHWIDITRCWLGETHIATVWASDSRTPDQPSVARNPWSADIHLTCDNGSTASVRVVGDVHTAVPSCPFWIHGSRGTIRGSVLLGSDQLNLDDGEGTTGYDLQGQWFVDGFAGTMGELMSAIAEDREPENSAARTAGSVQIMLAARASAAQGGEPVRLDSRSGGLS